MSRSASSRSALTFDAFERLALTEESDARASALRQRYARGGRALGISVDRVDYTKGIPERLRALDRLWQESPELRGRFTMIVVATPSRTELTCHIRISRPRCSLRSARSTIAMARATGIRSF